MKHIWTEDTRAGFHFWELANEHLFNGAFVMVDLCLVQKKMIQESESLAKATFIHGHFFGAVGVLIGSATKSFYFHDGNKCVSNWLGKETVSHVVQMCRDGIRAATYFGKSLFVLDRYFLTIHLLTEWKAWEQTHPDMFYIKIYLWDQKLYHPLQFVLAEYDGKQIILVTTSLSIKLEDIITAYSYRFKIEAMFREMKQQFGAFFIISKQKLHQN